MAMPVELISGLLGAFIGGGFTLLGSHYTINRQYKQQKALEEEKALKSQLFALNSVHSEIKENLISLSIMHYAFKENEDSFENNNFPIFFVTDRWAKHRDEVQLLENKEDFLLISGFYLEIFLIQTLKNITKEQVLTISEKGLKAEERIESYIKTLSDE